MRRASDAVIGPGRPAGDLSRLLAWPGRDGAVLAGMLLLMLVLPIVLGVAAWGGNVALGGISTGNPLVTALAAPVRFVVPDVRGDSWTPMIRALAIVRGPHGDDLYATLFFAQHEKFQYPPTSLLWLDALRVLVGLDTATLNRINALVFLLNAAGGVLLCRALVRRGAAAPLADRSAWPLALLVGGLCLTFWPLIYGFTIGQIQLWIDALFTAALLLWSREHRLGAGIAIGLACTIKPQLGLLLPLALLWRQPGFAAGLAATVAAALLASVARYGLSSTLHYLDVLSFLSHHGESFRANQSINGLVNRLLANGDNLHWHADGFPPFLPAVYRCTMLGALVLSALPFALAIATRSRRPGPIDLSIAGLCFTMASPVAWEQHYGIAFPIFIVAICTALSRRPVPYGRIVPALLVVSWCLVGSNLQVLNLLSATWLNVLQSYVFIGALLLLGVLVGMALSRRYDTAGAEP